MDSMLSENAMEILKKRYLKKNEDGTLETPEDLFRRVANVIAEVEKNTYGSTPEQAEKLANDFFESMWKLDFIPNSPTLMNAGRELGQLSACFVLPVEDSMEGIFDAVKYAAMIHKSGGGTGFSFSRLRAKNSPVHSTGGIASGPVSFMKVFNAATEAVKQGGTRRGANMGILRVDHPDILEFISCKENSNEITNFNISVGITDAFMLALKDDMEYDLIDPHTNQSQGKLQAKEVFEHIVESAWRNGEPGLVFLDKMNNANPTPQVAQIEATNPCGEQPLLPYEACNLGSVNLSNMVRIADGKPAIDFEHLRYTVELGVRFLDDVIDANQYPLAIIDEMTRSNRKIGLGVMGFSDLLIKLAIPYNSEMAVETAGTVMSFIQKAGHEMSIKLAEERGTFPNYEKSIYFKKNKPLRNATVTTIAPTGTISMIAGCSSGIEPLFAVAYKKKVLDAVELIEANSIFEELSHLKGFYSEELMEQVAQSGHLAGIEGIPDDIKKIFVTAHEIDPEWHVQIQAEFQKFTDNAVSKTINFPNSATVDDIRTAYIRAFELGCKGITVYRDESRAVQVLSSGTSEKQQEAPTKGLHEEASSRAPIAPRKRPKITFGMTDKIVTGCGNIYTTINEDESGLCEVLIHLGKSGGCATSLVEAVARLISNGLRSGLDPKTIIKHLRGIRCPSPAPSYMNPDLGRPVYSCADAIATSLESYLLNGININNFSVNEGLPEKLAHNQMIDDENFRFNAGVCPECGSPVKHESGCTICMICGFSKCG